MSYKAPRRPQFFYTTAPLPCPYVAGRTERTAEPGNLGAQRGAGIGGQVRSPQFVDDPNGRDRPVGVHQEHGQQQALPDAGQRHGTAVDPYLDRAQ